MTNSLDKRIWSSLHEISVFQKASFFSVVIWGLITHLAVFSAGLMYHDALNYSGLASTYPSGRWMLGLLEDIGNRCLGIYELPYINGFFTLFMIAAASMQITKLLKVRSLSVSILIGAILASFPSVASLFAVMFTAAAYSLSFLLSVLSVSIVDRKQSVGRVAVGALLICVSLGIYQAYITFAVSLSLLILLCEALREPDAELKQLVRKGLCFIAMLVVGLVLYLLINKLFISCKGLKLTSYQNIDKMGVFTFRDIISAIKYAYSDQLKVQWQGIVSSVFMLRLTYAVEAITLLLFIVSLCSRRRSPGVCILAVVLFLLLPLALNSIYLICPGNYQGVHSLMRYSLVFTYIFPLLLIEQVCDEVRPGKARRILSSVSLAVLLIVPIGYTYRDNTAYLNAETAQKQAILYFNSFVTRIRDTEGYRDDLPVAYIGYSIEDGSFAQLPTHGKIYTYLLHFSGSELVSNYMWKEFCALHLGWAPPEIDDTTALADIEEVRAMPCYPDSGSIKVINDTVVVKISDVE